MSDDGQRAIVKGIDMREVGNEEQTLSLLFEGEAKTTVGHHAINAASSRSHTIFTFYLEVCFVEQVAVDFIFCCRELCDNYNTGVQEN